MQGNPYAEAIKRIFLITLGCAGVVLSIVVLFQGFATGRAPAVGRQIAAVRTHSLPEDPSQFWFGVVFYLVFGLAFGWIAWRSYRG